MHLLGIAGMGGGGAPYDRLPPPSLTPWRSTERQMPLEKEPGCRHSHSPLFERGHCVQGRGDPDGKNFKEKMFGV